ncbi:glycosyltransferase family 2 protein [Leyella stercorea]|uniref:glycosyltransferase family 2 protein n=1 Tax=Leyella stercorea TaxID=363265 RepID=UPI002673C2AE|nr:glycosyltransferase family 2 protein [Leyella stercorea]
MLISVIIPVYNVAPYLRRGLDSIIAQGGDDFEIILVDDGSKDASPAICDEYSLRYPFIKTYHIPNGGVGHARNFGIDKAQGQYIEFLDSDDFLDEGLYEKFRTVLNTHPDIDACFFGLKDFTEGRSNEGHFVKEGLYKMQTSLCKTEMDYSLQSLYLSVKQSFLFFSPSTKFFKTSLIRDHEIRFREDLHYYEDYLFNLHFFFHAKTIFAIGGKAYYNYVHHPGEHLGGKYTEASVIVDVAKEIYSLSERLPMSPQFHEYNVIEYYNNLLHAIDSTYDVKAFGKEAKTMQLIRLWLSEIKRLGHKDSFVNYLGNRKSLLAVPNPLYVYIMENLRMLALKFINK